MAVVIPIYILFQRLHLLDTYTALIITYVTSNLPIVIWLMRDYVSTIPIELEECASIDGASRYRIFSSVVLPLAVPGLVATFLFVLVFSWNEYLLALFISSAKVQTLPLTIVAQNATCGPAMVEYVRVDSDYDHSCDCDCHYPGTLYYPWFTDWCGQGITLMVNRQDPPGCSICV